MGAPQEQPRPNADAETLLNLVLKASQEGIVDHDLVRGVCLYSERWRNLLGYDAEHPFDSSCDLWKTLSHPDDLPLVEELWSDHVDQGWPFQHTWRMAHRHGGYRWVLCRSVVVLDPDGNPERALSLFSDVTERVEATEQHRALVEAIPDTIVRMDIDGTLMDVRFGRDEDVKEVLSAAVVGASMADVDAGLAACLCDLARSAVDTSSVKRSEWRSTHGSREISLDLRLSPSGAREVVCLITDVTHRKRLESQLLQAQKLESIGQLAAGVAHEINTPLQFIGDNARFVKMATERMIEILEGYRGLATERATEEERKALAKKDRRLKLKYLLENGPSAVESCISGVERVAEIVTAMKEFSHPGSDHPTETDLNQALRSTAKVSVNEWKHVAELNLELSEDLPMVQCFAGELNQCFLNIIVNAAHALRDKFGDSKQGRITVTTEQPDDASVEIQIRDNGPGMPEHVKQRIFDPFFTTKGVGRGTGQGLAIARDTVVHKHAGELLCETRVDEGTTFVIRLPIQAPRSEQAPPPETQNEASAA